MWYSTCTQRVEGKARPTGFLTGVKDEGQQSQKTRSTTRGPHKWPCSWVSPHSLCRRPGGRTRWQEKWYSTYKQGMEGKTRPTGSYITGAIDEGQQSQKTRSTTGGPHKWHCSWVSPHSPCRRPGGRTRWQEKWYSTGKQYETTHSERLAAFLRCCRFRGWPSQEMGREGEDTGEDVDAGVKLHTSSLKPLCQRGDVACSEETYWEVNGRSRGTFVRHCLPHHRNLNSTIFGWSYRHDVTSGTFQWLCHHDRRLNIFDGKY